MCVSSDHVWRLIPHAFLSTNCLWWGTRNTAAEDMNAISGCIRFLLSAPQIYTAFSVHFLRTSFLKLTAWVGVQSSHPWRISPSCGTEAPDGSTVFPRTNMSLLQILLTRENRSSGTELVLVFPCLPQIPEPDGAHARWFVGNQPPNYGTAMLKCFM
jgi:hypothetical protein